MTNQHIFITGGDGKTGVQKNYRDLIKHEHRSKCYTTDIDELIEVK